MRRIMIAGNWKLHKTPSEAAEFVGALAGVLGRGDAGCDVVVCPPYVALTAAVDAAKGTRIRVGAQNIYWEDDGAFTGEVSGPMLKDAGCDFVIIGHSERRQFFGETDETVNRRMQAARRHGLVPIFCLGESLEEREGGKTFEVVRRQLIGGMGEIRPEDPDRFVIAYEPVWAIGTGKTATPEQAQEVHGFLRSELGKLVARDFAEGVRILYGGSVKPDNAAGLVGCNDIDGGLVGGACLKIEDFTGIIKAAT
jgi:triosephosphate isomerase